MRGAADWASSWQTWGCSARQPASVRNAALRMVDGLARLATNGRCRDWAAPGDSRLCSVQGAVSGGLVDSIVFTGPHACDQIKRPTLDLDDHASDILPNDSEPDHL